MLSQEQNGWSSRQKHLIVLGKCKSVVLVVIPEMVKQLRGDVKKKSEMENESVKKNGVNVWWEWWKNVVVHVGCRATFKTCLF